MSKRPTAKKSKKKANSAASRRAKARRLIVRRKNQAAGADFPFETVVEVDAVRFHKDGTVDLFIEDADLPSLWNQPQRYYLLTFIESLQHYKDLMPNAELDLVASSGGKLILTNHPLPDSTPPAATPASAPSN